MGVQARLEISRLIYRPTMVNREHYDCQVVFSNQVKLAATNKGRIIVSKKKKKKKKLKLGKT